MSLPWQSQIRVAGRTMRRSCDLASAWLQQRTWRMKEQGKEIAAGFRNNWPFSRAGNLQPPGNGLGSALD
jgi:hypothetical protein